MSMRPSETNPAEVHNAASAMRLRAEIDQARAMQAAEPAATATTAATAAEGALSFDDLTEVEKSAASIGRFGSTTPKWKTDWTTTLLGEGREF